MSYVKRFFKSLKNDGLKETFILSNEFIFYLLLRFIQKFPLRNTIVFECESDMDDNPRAIYEYMIKEKMYRKYRLVWIVRNVDFCKENYANENTVFISRFDKTKKNQLVLNYYLSTAKWFIFSHPYWFKKSKKSQVVINTGHGCPLKSCKNENFDHTVFDYLLVTSESIAVPYAMAWSAPLEKCFSCNGYPKDDFLFSANKKNLLNKLFNFKDTEKIIMCMPTYKQSIRLQDSKINDPYVLSVISNNEELENLNTLLSKNKIHLIIKLHPLQLVDKLKLSNMTNIHYIQNSELFEKKILLYELLGVCDALLTDFSSVFYDYVILDKPIGFILNRLDDYTRGYAFDNPLEYMPGEKIYTYDELINFINNFINGKDSFSSKRNEICKYANGDYKGNCSEKFVNIMLNNNYKENCIKLEK